MLEIAYKIAKKNSMKVFVKIHPLDRSENYKFDKGITCLSSKIEKCDFIIAHTTSMIYQYLALGYKVFKLKSKIPSNNISHEIQFETYQELEDALRKEFDFVGESHRHIEVIGDDSKKRYSAFFSTLDD